MDARSSSTLQELGLVAWCLTLITLANYIRCRDHDTGFGPPSYWFASEAGKFHQTSHASCLVSLNSSDDELSSAKQLTTLTQLLRILSFRVSINSKCTQPITDSLTTISLSFPTKIGSGKGGRGITSIPPSQSSSKPLPEENCQ